MSKDKIKAPAPIATFWEKKLNFSFDAEIEYYRKLCGLKYKIRLLRKDSKYDVESEYFSLGKTRMPQKISTKMFRISLTKE